MKSRHSKRGFALLITITLVAFLVLILVSLATLTRVETRVAANSQQLDQARQNALMALNIAVGQLQKYAGPDQRTTARADLENPTGQANTHWTAVYGSSVAGDYATSISTVASEFTTPANTNSYGSTARLLNWLVSGNESVDFDPTWGGSGDVGTKGQITGYPDPSSATAIPFKPVGTIASLTTTTPATDPDITITNVTGAAKPARLLVGGNSVTSSLDAGNQPIDYVVAPAVDINAPENSVPGIGGSPVIGRYAWWVGDEGVKARLNLPAAGSDPLQSPAEQLDAQRLALTNSPRAAIELMSLNAPGWSATPSALDDPLIGSLYQSGNELTKVILPRQGVFYSTNSNALADSLKYRFHDVTTQSFNVLSDTYAGGLRQDLSRVLETGSTSPASSTTFWPATGNTTFVPTWGHLRDFANTTATDNKIQPRLPNYANGAAGQVGISPVLTYAALGFRYSTGGTPAAGVPINLDIYPIVTLWNPYANTLAGQTYEVGVRITFPSSQSGIKLSVNTGDDTTPNWVVRDVQDLARPGVTFPASDNTSGSPNDNSNIQSPIRFWRFKVTCPDLAPGESRVFTLRNATGAYNAGQNELVSTDYNPDHHVSISNTTLAADEVGRDFKFEPFTSSRLRSGVNAETGAYLGDGTAPPISQSGHWDPAVNKWYQSIQRVDYKGITDSYAEIQGPEPLRAPLAIDAPAFKVIFMCTFSSIGRTWTLNNAFGNNIPPFRWIAQGNPRAPYVFRTRRDPNFAGTYYARAGVDDQLWPTWFFENPTDATLASSGLGLDYDIGNNTNASKTIDATLFEFREDGRALNSIGQLQQANLSLASAYPAYPVGNSLADFRLPNTAWIETTAGRGLGGAEIAPRQSVYYDVSWLLNRALWDRYYFSTVPATGNTPDNPRMTRIGDDDVALHDQGLAAAQLLLAGGFNINSTSEQAWRAVLGGLNQLAYDPQSDAAVSAAAGVILSRFLRPTAGTDQPTDVAVSTSYNGGESSNAYFIGNDMKSLWQGYRELSPKQLAQLARNIVAEVRVRGPFLSLADFVNRRLIDDTEFVNAPTDDNTPYTLKSSLTADQQARYTTGMKGAIQAAIDATPGSGSGAYAINDLNDSNGGTEDSYWANTRTAGLSSGTRRYYSLPLARGDANPSGDKHPQNTTAAFAPKFLTQGDVLSAIGSGLSARSDTFTVRAYGETINPATGDISGRAWCEAVVQRFPEYVDETADTPEIGPTSLSSTTNQTFGRKFKVVSFRWLTPNDI